MCYTLATHQFHVIRGNGGEELIDGNTATLPWCALAGKIWEGFQAGKFIHDDEIKYLKPADVQVATDIHLVMLSCCVSGPSCALSCFTAIHQMNELAESTITVQYTDVSSTSTEPITTPLYPHVSHPQHPVSPNQNPTLPNPDLPTTSQQFEERPSREAMLAILYFLYTGKTSRVNGSTAMDVLCLLGAEGVGLGLGEKRWEVSDGDLQ